jgi:hypothetical protein
MNRRRVVTLLVAMVLGSIIAGGGVTATSAQPPSPGPGPVGPQAPGEGRSRAATLDERFAAIAQRVSGFGGMFRDGDVLKVYLVDRGQGAAAERAIAETFGPRRIPARGVQVLQAQYPFLQLRAWQEQMGALFDLPGVILTDIDESTNRLEVGVDQPGTISAVEQELARLRIPRAAVNIVITEPVRYAATLREKVRPIVGGLQIAFGPGGASPPVGLCTLGFNAIRAGVEGFVGNSHCTMTPGDVLVPTSYYQPDATTVGTLIGTEVADPAYTQAQCPPGRRGGRVWTCRWSDSAFSQRAADVEGGNTGLGRIARPGGPNTSSLTIEGFFQIDSEGGSLRGDTVNKVGRTTGWTQGDVTRTCVHTVPFGTNIVLLCQDVVAAGRDFGDSGSPVFQITTPAADPTVQLRGILWGISGTRNGTPTFIYSPIGNVEKDLGELTTCASC